MENDKKSRVYVSLRIKKVTRIKLKNIWRAPLTGRNTLVVYTLQLQELTSM